MTEILDKPVVFTAQTITPEVTLALLVPIATSFGKRAMQWFDTARSEQARFVGEIRATQAAEDIADVLTTGGADFSKMYFFDPMRRAQDVRNRAAQLGTPLTAAEITRVILAEANDLF